MPGLFPEHCGVVMVCAFRRDTGYALQAAREPGLVPGESCKDSVKRFFCLLHSRVTGRTGVFEYSTQTQGSVMSAGEHTRSLLLRLLNSMCNA